MLVQIIPRHSLIHGHVRLKASHLGNILVKWFVQLSGAWKHSGVKHRRAAITFFFLFPPQNRHGNTVNERHIDN